MPTQQPVLPSGQRILDSEHCTLGVQRSGDECRTRRQFQPQGGQCTEIVGFNYLESLPNRIGGHTENPPRRSPTSLIPGQGSDHCVDTPLPQFCRSGLC